VLSNLIFLDNREVPSSLPLILDGMGEKYELTQLTFVDVQICGIPVKVVGTYGEVIFYVIERKSGEDFIASMVSGHLQSQLYRMSTTCKHSVLIIEGSIGLALELSNVNPDSVYSAMVGTFLKHSEDGEKGSVSLLMVDDLGMFANLIKFTNNKLMEPLTRVEPMALPDVVDDDAQLRARVRCLLAISGLGEDRARSILAKMGSLKAIANATPEQLLCEGVGLTSAKKVVEFFSKTQSL